MASICFGSTGEEPSEVDRLPFLKWPADCVRLLSRSKTCLRDELCAREVLARVLSFRRCFAFMYRGDRGLGLTNPELEVSVGVVDSLPALIGLLIILLAEIAGPVLDIFDVSLLLGDCRLGNLETVRDGFQL